MGKTKIYRRQPGEAIVGCLSFCAFELCAFASQSHILTGEPLIVKAGRNTLATHVATKSELWTGVLGLGVFQLMSICLFLGWLNIRISVDDVGIRATNLFRIQVFNATWNEILRVSRNRNYLDGTDVYRLYTDSSVMKYNGRLPYYDELTDLIQKNCRHVNFSSWHA